MCFEWSINFLGLTEEVGIPLHPNRRLRIFLKGDHHFLFAEVSKMLVKIGKKIVLGLAAVLALSFLGTQPAAAQQKVKDSVSRHTGGGFWENNRASRGIQHARDYSRSIQQYSTQAPKLNPVVTKSESVMLGHQIQGIQREMVIIREENLSNPQVVEPVKVIDTKLAQAATTQTMLHEECCKDSPNGKVCAEMAGKVTSTLDQVAKDHAKLLATMGHEDAAVNHDHAIAEALAPATAAK